MLHGEQVQQMSHESNTGSCVHGVAVVQRGERPTSDTCVCTAIQRTGLHVLHGRHVQHMKTKRSE